MRKRVIPVLTISGNRLVKTVKFKNPKYIGEPINAIKIFNEKRVDELVVLDIDANKNNSNPNYNLIHEMASEAFMPIAYGGGITNLEQAKKIMDLGVEKIVLNSIIFQNFKIIEQLSKVFGSQSVCVSLDYKKNLFGKFKPVFNSASKTLNEDVLSFAAKIEEFGAGEIFLNDVDRDGTFAGYNQEILTKLNGIKIPVVMMGGCKNYDDIKTTLKNGADSVAASSIFIFKNNDRDSILINYIK